MYNEVGKINVNDKIYMIWFCINVMSVIWVFKCGE